MTIYRLAFLLGPTAVRDLIGGSAGVVLFAAAVALGCAFASAGIFAWYAFFGVLGVVSLSTSVPTVRALTRVGAINVDELEVLPIRKAA